MARFKKNIVLFLINNFLSFTRFFLLKNKLLNLAGIKIGEGTRIVGPIYFGNQLDLVIGENCWIGKYLSCDGNGIVRIGDNIDIGPHVTISTGSHEVGNSTRRAGKGIKTKVKIESGSWIGTKSLIINNTTIGKGSIVAAGSIVIRDVKPNKLVAGNPAIEKKDLMNRSIKNENSIHHTHA